MANKMKAAVLHEFNQPLQIEEVDIPTPGPGQIVVKMQASHWSGCLLFSVRFFLEFPTSQK